VTERIPRKHVNNLDEINHEYIFCEETGILHQKFR